MSPHAAPDSGSGRKCALQGSSVVLGQGWGSRARQAGARGPPPALSPGACPLRALSLPVCVLPGSPPAGLLRPGAEGEWVFSPFTSLPSSCRCLLSSHLRFPYLSEFS